MQEIFWDEAEKYNVLPIDNSKVERLDVSNRPSLTAGRDQFTYYAGLVRIPEGAAPDMKNKSYKITADVVIPKNGANGILITHGGRFSGYGLYLLNGKPTFAYNLAGVKHYKIASKTALSAGTHNIQLDFKYDGGGLGKGGLATLQVNGKTVASGRIDRTLPFRLSLDETMDCGEDTGTPINEDYKVPFKFTGEIKKVMIDLKPAELTASAQQEVTANQIALDLAR